MNASQPTGGRTALPKLLGAHGGTGAWFLIVFVVLLATLTASPAAELKFPQLWKTDLESFLETAATVADITGEGRDEVLVAGREELFARDGNGKALWGWRTKTRFMTYPAVLARPGQPSLIYVADTGGLFACLDGTGKEVWHAQLKGRQGGPLPWSAILTEMETLKSSRLMKPARYGPSRP